MTQALFLLIIFAGHFYILVPSTPGPRRQELWATAVAAHQSPKPLSLDQIEEMLKYKYEDEIISGEIRRKGIAFRVDPATLERLLKQGVSSLTKQALLREEEKAAYGDFSNERNLEKRLTLGREFAQKYPSNSETSKVTAELRKLELDIFESAFRKFSDNPGASGLNDLLTTGRDLLDRRKDNATALQVRPRLALATGRGMLNKFYNDLERSHDYANQALELLESPTPPPGVDAKAYREIRASSLSLIYQCLALYQTDPEKAIELLTKAAEMKDSPAANDPATFWLRAQSRQEIFQKWSDEYRALSKTQRVSRQGQSICAKISPLVNQLVFDYTQVLSLNSRGNSPQLKDEAAEALQSLVTGERPCLGGRSGSIDEWPSDEKRFALVIGVEDYLDKSVGKFNYATSDARAVADALTRYGGFKKEKVVLLANSEPVDRQPIRSVVLQQLRQLPDHVKEDGLLLIYFVGHGFENAGKTYLLPADSVTNDETLLSETAINVERFKELIRASGAGQVMLIFDAFRRTPVSETFSRQLSFDVRNNEVTAFATLLSASAGQRAYESQLKKQGYFTSVFLEAAKGKAATKKRGVTLDDLTNYLQAHVPQEALRENGRGAQQSPTALIEGYEKEDLVMFTSDNGGAQSPKLTPAELIRNSKSITVRSKSVYMNRAILQAELNKLAELKAWDLKVVNDEKEADLVVEVRLPALTWMWNYTIIHRPSNTTLTSGKERGLTDDSVSPRLAKNLIDNLQRIRNSTQ